jgi:hypothetical protein
MCVKDFITQRSINLQAAIFIIIFTLSFCFYCHLNSDMEHLYFWKCILCVCVCVRACVHAHVRLCYSCYVVIVFHCGRAVYCTYVLPNKKLKNASLYHTKFSDVYFIYSVYVLKY